MPAFIIPPHIPERHHAGICDELNLREELDAGCFLTGHPRIREPLGNATLAFGEDHVFLFGPGDAPLGSVSYPSIVSIAVESHDAVKARFNEARLMRLGHLLLAFRSRGATDASYVIVEWEGGEDGGETGRHDGIFCIEGLAADSRARQLRDAILHHTACYRRLTHAALLEPFNSQLDAFLARRCEHCGKMLRPAVAKPQRSAA